MPTASTRTGETARKRDWIARAAGILLGIATTRPVMGVLFATSSRTHLSPREFFGIGFSTKALLIELGCARDGVRNCMNQALGRGVFEQRKAWIALTHELIQHLGILCPA